MTPAATLGVVDAQTRNSKHQTRNLQPDVSAAMTGSGREWTAPASLTDNRVDVIETGRKTISYHLSRK